MGVLRGDFVDTEKKIRLIVGILVITSSALAFYKSVYWLWLGIFAAVMLIQSAFTNFCPMECILNKVCKTKTVETNTSTAEPVQSVAQTSELTEKTIITEDAKPVKPAKKAKSTKHKKN